MKISYHSPFVSTLEGLLSRGDERVGDILLDAWNRGARLDAWEDRLDIGVWRQVLADAPPSLISETLGEHSTDCPLPWDDVFIRVGKNYFLEELKRSQNLTRSRVCTENCTEPCGSCSTDGISVHNKINTIIPSTPSLENSKNSPGTEGHQEPCARTVFRFRKIGPSAFLPHRAIIETFYRAIQLVGLPVVFSNGFNPLPKLEIEDPIPLGMESLDDYFSLQLLGETDSSSLVENLNKLLPVGLEVLDTVSYPIQKFVKNRSLSSLYWGSDYWFEGTCGEHLEALRRCLEDPRLSGSSVRVEDTPNGEQRLFLRLKAAGNRAIGFGAVFETTFGAPFLKSPVRATRMCQWSDTGHGLASMFETLNEIYTGTGNDA